jgi:hypothetical protein
LRKNEYLAIKRRPVGRRRAIRRWGKRKANAEPQQLYTPWLPLEDHEWLKGYCERTGLGRNQAILRAVRLLRVAVETELGDVTTPKVEEP